MIKITEDIYYTGVNDRDTHLFEAMIPIPEGVSYNAYLIDDEKTVLIDTVKADYSDSLITDIRAVIGERKLDYLVINHMEPDHSGSIKSILEAYPDLVIIGNKKTENFIKGFYHIEPEMHIVKDGDKIELGKHQLNFYMTPMLHWPETMMTFESSKGFLFSGDAFGGFGALAGGVFDDEVDFSFYESEMLRYYANIVGRYSDMVQRALKKLENLDVNYIGATHGIVWRENPGTVVDLYDLWSKQETEKGVVIVYGSMYGNTRNLAETIARQFAINGIKNIKVYDVARTHPSYIVRDIWKYKAFLLGSSTYNGGMFPPMESLVRKLDNVKLKNKLVGVFGTYSWSGESVQLLQGACNNSDIKLIEPVIRHAFAPDEAAKEQGKELVANMVAAMKQ